MPGIDVEAYADDWDDDPGARPRRKKLSAKAREAIESHAPARVVAVDRGRVTVWHEADGDGGGREVEARYAGAMRRRKVVVGDDVRVKPPRHEADQARITDLLERRTVLARTADDADDEERVVVANADQVVVVLTAEWLEGGIGFLDRVLVAASAGGLGAVVCVNKVDLLPAPDGDMAGGAGGGAAGGAMAAVARLEEVYGGLGLPVVRTSAVTGEGIDRLRELLAGCWTAFAGHSGVGKSSLFNLLVPGVDQAVADVGRRGGRHTTVAARAHRVPSLDAWLVDTPGVRSFGLAHLAPESLVDHFPELAGLDDEAIQALVNGERVEVPGADPARLATFHRFREALVAGDIDRSEPERAERDVAGSAGAPDGPAGQGR